MVAHQQCLAEYLKSQAVRSVHLPSFVDPTGSIMFENGDRLIELSVHHLLEGLGIERRDDSREADLDVFLGCGGWHEKYDFVPGLVRRHAQNHPERPYCVLPTTFHCPTTSVRDRIGDHAGPVSLFCRDRTSFEQLAADPKLATWDIGLDHDTVFALAESPWLRALPNEQRHVLIVERRDREHPINDFEAYETRRYWKIRSGIPHAVKRLVYPLYLRAQALRPTRFVRACERLLASEHETWTDAPRVVEDISNSRFVSFSRFGELIGRAAVVFTTRLHVGILAALLQKPTYLFEGAYHKIGSLYEYSLADRPCVRLVRSEEWVRGD